MNTPATARTIVSVSLKNCSSLLVSPDYAGVEGWLEPVPKYENAQRPPPKMAKPTSNGNITFHSKPISLLMLVRSATTLDSGDLVRIAKISRPNKAKGNIKDTLDMNRAIVALSTLNPPYCYRMLLIEHKFGSSHVVNEQVVVRNIIARCLATQLGEARRKSPIFGRGRLLGRRVPR